MNDEKPISLPMALFVSIGVVLSLVLLKNQAYVNANADQILGAVSLLKNYLIFYSGLLFLNTILVVHFLRRKLALSDQGARLRAIKKKDESLKWTYFKAMSLLVIGGALGFYLEKALMNGVRIQGGGQFYFYQYSFFILNTAFMFWFINSRLSVLYKILSKALKTRSIPKLKHEVDSITLGTENEEKLDEEVSWVKQNKTALNGSMLITGSVGSGKTAGAILPIFKQILTNFDRASILAIDPKRTFIKNVKPIIAEHKKKSMRVRVLSLDGEESFNPVYMEKPLKKQRFLEIAEIVKASTLNFSGGKNDSPFWDISAYNLMKNCIVFCAGTMGYFTIRDIYDVMIKASTDDLDLILEKKMNEQIELKMMRSQLQMMPQLKAA